MILMIVLGIIPGLAWLVFYLKEDARHPEPKKLILYTFIAGGLVTVFVLQLQILVNNWVTGQGISTYSLISFIFLGAIEEIFKFLTVYVVVSRRREFDEPIDAMVYMIVAALGFATVENIASIIQASSLAISSPGPLETSALRFIGATLLHSLTSAVIGYYWGKAIARGGSRWSAIGWGLVLATLLHALFNYLIIKSEPVALPLILLVFIGLFVLNDFEKLKRIEK
ncbi:MAG: PrsW family intramembrane metalloprotease [bacterium]|nr:PrsW family intramembrane metalloprotease [bacterium]